MPLIAGFDQIRGRYYRWGQFGQIYYVRDHGNQMAMELAREWGKLERLRGGYKKEDPTEQTGVGD